MLHLRDELAGRPLRPVAALAAAEEERRDREQADDVGEVVVAARLAPLEMRADEPAVQQEAVERALEPGLGGACSAASASAATQFAARIATSIVASPVRTPSSTGLAAIQLSSWAPSSSRYRDRRQP